MRSSIDAGNDGAAPPRSVPGTRRASVFWRPAAPTCCRFLSIPVNGRRRCATRPVPRSSRTWSVR